MVRARLSVRVAVIVAATLTLAVGVAAAAVDAPAPGGPSAARSSSARTLFRANCGSCHKLRDAGTKGTDGPNLDKRFKGVPPKKIKRITKRVIANGKGSMPAGILTGDQARAVANYVARVAGRR